MASCWLTCAPWSGRGCRISTPSRPGQGRQRLRTSAIRSTSHVYAPKAAQHEGSSTLRLTAQLEVGHLVEQVSDRFDEFHSSQRRTEAEVQPGTEGEVGIVATPYVEVVCPLEDRRVAVGRA